MGRGVMNQIKNSQIFCGYDPDSLITYTTTKKVVIKDCFLGSTAYFFMFIALCYSVGYVLFWEKGYLQRVTPSGVSRLTLRAPDYSDIPESKLQYCKQFNMSAPYPCLFKPAQLYVQPPALGGQMFISTHVRKSVLNYSKCNGFLEKNCGNASDSDVSTWYNGAVENSTLFIDHTVQAEDIEKSLMNMYGVLRSCKGTDYDVHLPAVGDHETRIEYIARTTFRVADILAHASTQDGCGLKMDDISMADDEPMPFRDAGTVVVIYITYSNLHRTFQLPIEYEVEARVLSRQKYKVEQHTEKDDGLVTFVNRHGLLVTVVQSGEIGEFMLSGLFVQLAGALAIITVGTTITDLLARYLMRDRRIYRAAMFDYTNDIDDIREGARVLMDSMEHEGLVGGPQSPATGAAAPLLGA